MHGYPEQNAPRNRLIAQSLKLSAAVLVGGLALVMLLDRDGVRPTGAAAPAAEPARSTAARPVSELVLRAGSHGHFMVEAAVNGTPVTFLVDTGASAIYLTPDDAARLGWTPQQLTYSERYATASGVVHAAPVTLRSLRIGQLELYDLAASVGEQPSSISLLGMSFLKRFESYEVRGDRLILTW
jgi:aspartyl protease family protein